MSVIGAADFVVMNVLGAQLANQAVDGLIGFLGDGFLHLHLEDEMRSALKVEAELDLVAKVIFYLLQRGRKGRRADEHVDADENDSKDE